ncbi:MAG TPA: hypothetical protein VFG72_10515 [Marmoricola sp.]|nr:hypothetical protein [Marmoricola sp.]
MPKTLPPGTVAVGNDAFRASAVPDVFDARDLEYRPRLEPLAPSLDRRLGDRHVSTQTGNSCTGHAVAAMINAVLRNHDLRTRRTGKAAEGQGIEEQPIRVSPTMLYAMARRYDEFEGEEDAGSSLRGALKGWFYHGVLPEEDWPEGATVEIDLDPVLAEKAMRHPLGAFYRVNPFRLDDMQSAISELYGIAASSVIHEGWQEPRVVVKDGERMTVIERAPGAALLGGHAYALVGYNEVGFLVKNSWGADWGRHGCATLPYDDWLQSAYDAWVARPGVHSLVSSRERIKLVEDTAGGLATGPGPDLVRLQRHVVNLGNEGLLSTSGRFRSTPKQVDLVFSRMQEYHDRWQAAEATSGPRRVVLYAHGGLNSEGTGLSIAQKHLNWWLNNHVYPVTFAWQSGAVESLLDHLADTVEDKLPFGGLGIDLVEQFDRLVERFARSHVRWMWDEMKENARAASKPTPRKIVWPQDGSDPAPSLASVPGATLAVDRLAAYVAAAPKEAVEVHLVGHSAGSIFLAAMLQRLVDAQVPVASISFLAPAITVDAFADEVLPHLTSRTAPRFVSFGLTDRRELDDVCGVHGKAIYQKSLLYLVSRALERPGNPERSRRGWPKDVAEVPLVGMERFQDTPVAGGTPLRHALPDAALVWAPTGQPPGSRTDADSHGDFDDDAPTMTSVVTRILGHPEEPTETMVYAANKALRDPADALDSPPPPHSGETAEARDAGVVPVKVTGAPQSDVEVPAVREGRLPEEKVAPQSSSAVMDALLRDGWRSAHDEEAQQQYRRRTSTVTSEEG